jgi:MFS family permease
MNSASDTVDTGQSGRGLFYGWVVVIAAFLAFGVVYGSVLYSFSVFVNPIAKSFATTPTKVLFGFTLVNVGTGVLGVYGGRFLARYSLRLGMAIGLAVMAAGYLALSMANELWQLYVAYGVIVAFGAVVVAPLGASALVTNWFTASRGRALTMATLGTSFGQLLLPRLAASVIESAGWQSAYQVFALVMVLTIPLVYLIAVDKPEHKGLLPFGGLPPSSSDAAAPALLTTGEILRNRDFWTIGVSFVLTVTVYLALIATMVPYARTFGVTALQASQLVVCMGVFAIVGKLAFATFTDRMGLRNTFWIAIALNLVACVLLVTVTGYGVLFVASALAGGSAGGVLPLWPGMIGARFGRHALPQVMGLMSPMVLSIQGFGAPFATAMGFAPAFVVFVGMLLISAFLSRNISKPVAG